MTIKEPPRVATWLLWHLGPGYGRESLSGDLFEEYQLRRTRAWYWRQVLAAIWIARTKPLRMQWIRQITAATVLRITIEIGALIGAGALAQQAVMANTPDLAQQSARRSSVQQPSYNPLHQYADGK